MMNDRAGRSGVWTVAPDPQQDMTDMIRSINPFNPGRRISPGALAAIAVATMVAPVAAEARIVRGGAYDGIWNVVFATTQGTCSSGYRVPFTVHGGRVSSAGGGRVSGAVNRGGGVAVSVSVGASRASGGGRLAGNFGAGYWRGIISGDRCSGTWQASRG
jgi:hypothetical protein